MPILKNNKIVNYSEIARKLNISPSYVKLLLTGKRKSERYAKAIQDLLKRETSPPNRAA